MHTDEKQSEIEVYDNTDETKPEYGSVWSDEHHEHLLDIGPQGMFERLLEEHVTENDVLVLGCGGGKYVDRFSQRDERCRAVGIELSAERLREADNQSSSPHVELCRADAERLPFVPESFDIVIAHSVLHHLPNWDTDGLAGVTEILRDDGALLFYEPGAYNPPAAVRRRFFPSRVHTPGETPFDPNGFERRLEEYFAEVAVEGHCIISNALPVLARYAPFEVSLSLVEQAYTAESRVIDSVGRQLAWILTGIARGPR